MTDFWVVQCDCVMGEEKSTQQVIK